MYTWTNFLAAAIGNFQASGLIDSQHNCRRSKSQTIITVNITLKSVQGWSQLSTCLFADQWKYSQYVVLDDPVPLLCGLHFFLLQCMASQSYINVTCIETKLTDPSNESGFYTSELPSQFLRMVLVQYKGYYMQFSCLNQNCKQPLYLTIYFS